MINTHLPGFPYSNFHQLNLDWIVASMKANTELVNDIAKNVTQIATDAVQEWISNNAANLILSAFYDSDTETLILKTDVNYNLQEV